MKGTLTKGLAVIATFWGMVFAAVSWASTSQAEVWQHPMFDEQKTLQVGCDGQGQYPGAVDYTAETPKAGQR